VFTALYELSPYIKNTCFFLKGLTKILYRTEFLVLRAHKKTVAFFRKLMII
jgi:hypothetical protein